MKIFHFLLNSKFALVCLILAAGSLKADEKDFYSQVDPQTRLQILANMRVHERNDLIEKLDVVAYLNEKCQFPYTRGADGMPVRPQVSCEYKPRGIDDEFNGMSAKFDCTFTRQSKNGEYKNKTLKVKYEPKKYPGGGYKEIPQAIMGTLFSRLMGFYTNAYCPVDLICKGCPSENPWSYGKSKGKAVPNSIIEFKNVVVESKLNGFKVVDNKNSMREIPQGFSFREIHHHFPQTSEETDKILKAERDALTLWINFVVSNDADYHNNKLFCMNSIKPSSADEKPVCSFSVGVINDYGNSFGYKNADTKLKISRFLQNTINYTSNKELLTTGASGNAGAANQPVSAAGLDLFINQAEAISDQQLLDVFHLAQIDKVSDNSAQDWLNAFRKKIQLMK